MPDVLQTQHDFSKTDAIDKILVGLSRKAKAARDRGDWQMVRDAGRLIDSWLDKRLRCG